MRVLSRARTASRASPVISGMADSAKISGSTNQRARTVALIQGVAIEINTMPPTIGAQAMRAHSMARCCNAPSVFMISQAAPSST